MSLHAIPQLPEGVLIQEFFRDSGLIYRVTEDGRWLVTDPGKPEQERPARPRHDDPGRVPEAGLRRIREAIEALRADEAGPADGRPIAVTVRTARGVETHELSAQPGRPDSYGPLAPLARVLGDDVYGTWMEE